MNANLPTFSELQFANPADFDAWYSTLDCKTYSLRKAETELACLARYLKSLRNHPGHPIYWPLTVLKRESPDFSIFQDGFPTIGLEHSTVTTTKYQAFRAESLKGTEDRIVWLDSFKIGGPPTQWYNEGWVGSEAEQEWAQLALQRILDKLVLLNSLRFTKFDRNELLLNTVSYLPNLDMTLAFKHLSKILTASVQESNPLCSFDSITFIYGSDTYPHALVKHQST
ncbi:MAG: hypothetical protein Q8P51_05590 [Ignavibacteria bacterium]|nr:hypothetical protein [Ignavibacteria bacterium]